MTKSTATKAQSSQTLHLENASTQQLVSLCGQFDQHLKQVEQRIEVTIIHRGSEFRIEGPQEQAQAAIEILENLYQDITEGLKISPEKVHMAIEQGYRAADENSTVDEAMSKVTVINTKKGSIKPRTQNQHQYVAAVLTHDINFGIGPAGTGKTYLAVACAVQALLKDEIERILLVRPAVEAGEKLGFLPGDLSQKVDPYLRPLYDALYEMLGFETVDKLIERNVIEVAPLAYMRGRTLNGAFIILDESQNTTREQMKMFLTRIGCGSTAVINGDPSQIDLPRGQASGLKHAVEVLDGVDGISFTHFTSRDVVRHPLVQRIVDAYDKFDTQQ